MGVKGLWDLLEPVAIHASLQHYAIQHGFVGNQGGDRGLRLGVDALGWIFRACYRHSTTRNPELASLYARCSRLVQLPILPLFVFDGPGRPKIKRGKHVRGNSHWIEAEFKEMLNAFGFQWIEAPGEADAELAQLTNHHVLDAILTEDGDSFVFGAKTVLRIDSNVPEDKQVVVYRAEEIERHKELGLSAADFVLIALLVGGDYDKGIKNCGIETAFGLARAGLGQSLIIGIQNYTGHGLREYLRQWRNDLRTEARTNKSGCLPHRCPSLSNNIPDSFPSASVLDLYFHPLVSNNTNIPCLFSNTLSPTLLARFVKDHFTWGDVMGILDHFSTTIFPGLAIRSSMEVARANDLGFSRSHTYLGPIVGQRDLSSELALEDTCRRYPETRIQLAISQELINDIVASLEPNPSLDKEKLCTWISRDRLRLRAWVPAKILETIGHNTN